MKLKNCPFCGGEAEMFKIKQYFIQCVSCHAFIAHDELQEAVFKWNSRVIDQETKNLCHELEQIRDELRKDVN